MAKFQPMIITVFLFTLFTYHILSGEGRLIKSLNGVRISYVASPSPRSIRKLGDLIAQSDHSQTSPLKTASRKASADFSQTAVNQNKFPTSKLAQSSPGRSQTVNSFKVNKVDADVQGNCPGIKCVDDFRPTEPGHSPGAGHSSLTSTDMSQDQLTRSPGAGHALEDDNRESSPKTAKVQNTLPSSSLTPSSLFSDSATTYKNDFRPTSPGSSPGAGHHEANQKGTEMIGNCLGEKCIDGFRPTAPGDSPGAGHVVVSKSGKITPNPQSKHMDVAHPHAGETDDFRPTTPGHSPGAGHSTLEN